MSSWTTSFQSPLSDLPQLTSLDLTLTTRLDDEYSYQTLHRITRVRIRCSLDDFPGMYSINTYAGFEIFLQRLRLMLSLLPKLDTLEFHAADHKKGQMPLLLAHGIYAMLIAACGVVADTLRTLVLPRGWFTWPGARPPDVVMLQEEDQTGAFTGHITDLRALAALEKLDVHSTAIIAKEQFDTEVADPTQTLPTSIKHITVLGAHDGLWSWIDDVLDHRGTHFPHLAEITLLKQEPVDVALRLTNLEGLRKSHASLWKRLEANSLAVNGDV